MHCAKIIKLMLLIKVCRSSNLANSMFNSINHQRKENGLHPFRSITDLENAAKDQALYMCENSILTHDNPNGNLQERVRRNGFKGKSMAENIAKNHSDSYDDVIKMWMNSPNHKKNILGNYTYTGVATCLDKKGSRFWVQVFGNNGDMNMNSDIESETGNMTSEEANLNKHTGKNNQKDEKYDRNKNKSKLKNEPETGKNSNSNNLSKNFNNEVSKDFSELIDDISNETKNYRRKKKSISSNIPCPKTDLSTILDKFSGLDLPKIGSFVSTQIIYVYSTPTILKTVSKDISSIENSTVSIEIDKPTTITSTLTSTLESHITKTQIITKNETKTVSEINTKTITKTEISTISPSTSIISTTLIFSQAKFSENEPQTSSSTKTITRTVQITKSVILKTESNPSTKSKRKSNFSPRTRQTKIRSAPVVISTVFIKNDKGSRESEDIDSNDINSENSGPNIMNTDNDPNDYRSPEENEEDDNQNEYPDLIQPTIPFLRKPHQNSHNRNKFVNLGQNKRRQIDENNQFHKSKRGRNNIKRNLDEILSSGFDLTLNIKPKKRRSQDFEK